MATAAQIDLTQEMALVGVPLPVTLRPPMRLNDEELIAFSCRNKPFRIESNADGDLEIMSPVGFDGGKREMFVGAKLFEWAEHYGGTTVSPNAGFRLKDGSVRSPDASWISGASYTALSDVAKRGFAPICPDFLIEILSESDSRTTLEAKMEMWLANGAQLAWMIDPFAADLTIYRTGQAPESLLRPDWVEADTVVPGFRLETSRLWAK